eukprot:5070795-Lingulodinium_polyedra.AAC.1
MGRTIVRNQRTPGRRWQSVSTPSRVLSKSPTRHWGSTTERSRKKARCGSPKYRGIQRMKRAHPRAKLFLSRALGPWGSEKWDCFADTLHGPQ